MTSTTLPSGAITHALRALAGHIDERHLAAPVAIDVRPDHLTVRIPSRGAEAWATTLADGSGLDCFTATDVTYWHTTGLLPDSGVRVRLEWARRVDVDPAHLELVPDPPPADAMDAAIVILERHLTTTGGA